MIGVGGGGGVGVGEGEWEWSLECFDLDLEEAEYLSFSLSFLRLLRKVGMRCSRIPHSASPSFAFLSLGGVTLILGPTTLMFWECLRVWRKRGERAPLFLGACTNSTTREQTLFLLRRDWRQRHSPASSGRASSAMRPEEDLKQSPCGSASRNAASLAKDPKLSPRDTCCGCGEKAAACLSLTETMFLMPRECSGLSLGESRGSWSASGDWLKVLFLRKALGFSFSSSLSCLSVLSCCCSYHCGSLGLKGSKPLPMTGVAGLSFCCGPSSSSCSSQFMMSFSNSRLSSSWRSSCPVSRLLLPNANSCVSLKWGVSISLDFSAAGPPSPLSSRKLKSLMSLWSTPFFFMVPSFDFNCSLVSLVLALPSFSMYSPKKRPLALARQQPSSWRRKREGSWRCGTSKNSSRFSTAGSKGSGKEQSSPPSTSSFPRIARRNTTNASTSNAELSRIATPPLTRSALEREDSVSACRKRVIMALAWRLSMARSRAGEWE